MGQGDAVSGEGIHHIVAGNRHMLKDTVVLGNSREMTLLSAGGWVLFFFFEGIDKKQVISTDSENYWFKEIFEMTGC